jgi:uncharacterized protein (TIGR02118 family)
VASAATGVGALTVLDAGSVQAQAPMMSLNVIYPNKEGAKFDAAYYRATHIPLAMKVMKAEKVILIEGVARGSTPAPYVMIAHFQFASLEALQASTADPGMTDVRADIAKFTDITPTIMIGKTV